MNKFFALVIALIVSATAFAHDFGYRDGPGYRDNHRHDHRSQSIGRQIAEEGIGAAVAIAAIPVGAALGERMTRAILGTPAQQTTTHVVYVPVPACDDRPFVRGGLIYANPCDGSGVGAVVVGSVDRR